MTEASLPATLEPGLYPGIPMAIYRAWSAINASSLRTMRDKSPMHMRYEQMHGRTETEAMKIGTAAHAAVLQPDLFETDYVEIPTFSGAGTRAAKEEWLAEHEGEIFLKADQLALVGRLCDAVRNHPRASALCEGQAETSMVWTDPNSGVLCKARPDMLSTRTSAVVDAKFVRDASPDAMSKALWQYGYALQAWFYLTGARECGEPRDKFIVVAVEKAMPHAIGVYVIGDATLQAASDQLGILLETYATCLASNEWPGYRGQFLDLPEWALRRIEQEVEING